MNRGGPAQASARRDPQTPARGRLTRPSHDRMIAGVAQGLANFSGLPVWGVRTVLVLSALMVNGLGIAAYVACWALIPQDGDELRSASTHLRTGARTGRPAANEKAARALARLTTAKEPVRLALLGMALIAAGVIVVIAASSGELSLSVWVPVVAVLAGSVLGLVQLDRNERERWLDPTGWASGVAWVRIVGGVLLVVVGVVMFLVPNLGPRALATVTVAVLVVLAGLAIVLAPWARRLITDLQSERAERVRQDERAEIAAHLHDSVLQTLALIQRRSHDSDEVAKLARAQERQLREYLYGAPGARAAGMAPTASPSTTPTGSPPHAEPTTVAAAARRICAEVEDTHGVPVELVTVGDADLNPARTALLHALREATLNAVRHGKQGVSVYLECIGEQVEAFVRDRGEGFDLESVPTDRLGVRESVIGRMQRAGGTARVRRAPGGGTEVALSLG